MITIIVIVIVIMMMNDIIITVGFHNFNLSNFPFESLKSEQINCGCFFDTMSDFNVPGSRPKDNDEISKIDRDGTYSYATQRDSNPELSDSGRARERKSEIEGEDN